MVEGLVAFPKFSVFVPFAVASMVTLPPNRKLAAPVLLRLTVSFPSPVRMVVFPCTAAPVPVMVTTSLPFPVLRVSDPVHWNVPKLSVIESDRLLPVMTMLAMFE